jgi:hypothetical protein
VTTPARGLDIRSMAMKFLEVVEEHFASAEVELPARRYLAPGAPDTVAWDCEQLVVSLTGLGWGQAPDLAPVTRKIGTQANLAMRHIVLSIQLIRCTPKPDRNGRPPEVEKIHAAGEQFMRDAGLLSQALVEACSQIKKDLDRADMAVPGVVEPGAAEGGYQGLEASMQITTGLLI